MADGIDATVDMVQPSGATAFEHRVAGHPDLAKLVASNHTVLAPGDLRYQLVRGAFVTHIPTKVS
jgi:hypothetical protein